MCRPNALFIWKPINSFARRLVLRQRPKATRRWHWTTPSMKCYTLPSLTGIKLLVVRIDGLYINCRERSSRSYWSSAFNEKFSGVCLHTCAIAFSVVGCKHGWREKLICSWMLRKRPTHPFWQATTHGIMTAFATTKRQATSFLRRQLRPTSPAVSLEINPNVTPGLVWCLLHDLIRVSGRD